MIGDYSIMDWVTLGGIVATIGAVVGVLITNSRDNKGLSNEHDDLKEKVSSETKSIKTDTKYLKEVVLEEKWARESLYQNTSRAKEILETIDIMQEVVHQNAALNAEVANLKVKNHELNRKQDDKSSKLLSAISRFEQKLGEFEMYGESEEIRSILKHIRNELSEYID